MFLQLQRSAIFVEKIIDKNISSVGARSLTRYIGYLLTGIRLRTYGA
jgi:hypothetical protein